MITKETLEIIKADSFPSPEQRNEALNHLVVFESMLIKQGERFALVLAYIQKLKGIALSYNLGNPIDLELPDYAKITSSTLQAVSDGVLSNPQLHQALDYYDMLEKYMKCHGEILTIYWLEVYHTKNRLQSYFDARRRNGRF